LHTQNVDAIDLKCTAGSLVSHELAMLGATDPDHGGNLVVFLEHFDRLNRKVGKEDRKNKGSNCG
jgi:hypothetical protein